MKHRLRKRTVAHRTSVEPETPNTSTAAPNDDSSTSTDLASAIRARFAPLGGVELDLPTSAPMRQPPDFD